MKKQSLYVFFSILLLTIAVIGSTYAFFTSTIGSNTNSLNTESSKFSVIYTGGTDIRGTMPITIDKTEAFKTEVNIRVPEDSVEAVSLLYIDIERLTTNLQISGFKWELYCYQNNIEKTEYNRSGNFNGYNDTTNNKLVLIDNFLTTTTNTTFVLYLWIDGNMTGNEVLGGEFSGYISATTEQFTGKLS